MKRALLFASLLAAASSFAAPAVTPRQMTNCVNSAVATATNEVMNYVVAQDAVLTEQISVVSNAIRGATNIIAYVDAGDYTLQTNITKVAGDVGTLSQRYVSVTNELRELGERDDALGTYIDTKSESDRAYTTAVSNALYAAIESHGSIDVSNIVVRLKEVEVVSTNASYTAAVAFSVATNAEGKANTAYNLAAGLTGLATNNFVDTYDVDEDGRYLHTTMKYVNGTPVITTFKYDVTYTPQYANYWKGFYVTSSSIDGIPAGTYYCLVNGGSSYYCDTVKTNRLAAGGILDVAITSGNIHFMHSNTVSILDSTDSTGYAGAYRIYSYTNSIAGRYVQGSMMILPYYLTTAQKDEAIGTSANIASVNGNAWANTAQTRLDSIRTTVTQIQTLSASARKLKASSFPLLGATQYTPIGLQQFPNCDKTDYNEYDPCEEDEYYENSMWWTPEDWNDASNWTIPDPITVSYTEDDGEHQYQVTSTFSSSSNKRAYDRVISSLGLNPPFVAFHGRPEKKKKFTCSRNGHIWVANKTSKTTCRKCIRKGCGKAEGHNQTCAATASDCARCDNEICTAYHEDKDGNIVADQWGECERYTFADGEAYHRGWHHEGAEAVMPNTTKQICSCICGYYGEGGVDVGDLTALVKLILN